MSLSPDIIYVSVKGGCEGGNFLSISISSLRNWEQERKDSEGKDPESVNCHESRISYNRLATLAVLRLVVELVRMSFKVVVRRLGDMLGID